MLKKPPLSLQTTTLWEYPSQDYGPNIHGDQHYRGASPAWVIWNLLQRYTRPGDLVVDPMAGSGTTLDVARELERRALGYDVNVTRPDVFHVDARKLPLEDAKADFVFVDPPYSRHIEYSDDPRCIGKLTAREDEYFASMRQVIAEIFRVMKDRRYMALYVSDSYQKGKGQEFVPIGFELFSILRQYFKPIDIVSVVRHNAKLKQGHWHKAAVEGNFFLRGFNYLFIMKKELDSVAPPAAALPDEAPAPQAAVEPTAAPPREHGKAPGGQKAPGGRKSPGGQKDRRRSGPRKGRSQGGAKGGKKPLGQKSRGHGKPGRQGPKR